MNLGKTIQDFRKKNHLSQEQLAERIGVARQTISKWELEETAPDLNQANKLSQILGLSLDELVGGNIESKSLEVNNTNKNDNHTLTQLIKTILYQALKCLSILIIGSLSLLLCLFGLTCLIVAMFLIFNKTVGNLIPVMPYVCGVFIAISLIMLSFLSILGSIWTVTLLRYINIVLNQSINKIKNKQKIIFTSCFLIKKKTLKRLTVLASIGFVITFILAFVLCVNSAGELDFWHRWKWFN